MDKETKNLQKSIIKSPEKIREFFCSLDGSMEPIDDSFCDRVLGLAKEENIDHFKLNETLGFEQFLYEGTPYEYIRELFAVLNPSVNDVVYDLGSGYGRVVLYGAITSSAKLKGIEIVPERVAECEKIKRNLKLDNAEFLRGNVLDLDFSDGTIFFLFNPFFSETLEKVGENLRALAKNKTIKIVTWGGSSNDFFEEQTWLKEFRAKNLPFSKMQFFVSQK